MTPIIGIFSTILAGLAILIIGCFYCVCADDGDISERSVYENADDSDDFARAGENAPVFMGKFSVVIILHHQHGWPDGCEALTDPTGARELTHRPRFTSITAVVIAAVTLAAVTIVFI